MYIELNELRMLRENDQMLEKPVSMNFEMYSE